MNAKHSVFVIYAEAIIYLLLYNLHDCTFNTSRKLLENRNENFPVVHYFRRKLELVLNIP